MLLATRSPPNASFFLLISRISLRLVLMRLCLHDLWTSRSNVLTAVSSTQWHLSCFSLKRARTHTLLMILQPWEIWDSKPGQYPILQEVLLMQIHKPHSHTQDLIRAAISTLHSAPKRHNVYDFFLHLSASLCMRIVPFHVTMHSRLVSNWCAFFLVKKCATIICVCFHKNEIPNFSAAKWWQTVIPLSKDMIWD